MFGVHFFLKKRTQKYRLYLNIKVVRRYSHDFANSVSLSPAILRERRKAGRAAVWGDLDKSEKWSDRNSD